MKIDLEEFRRKAKITQLELAEICDLSRYTISKYERDNNIPVALYRKLNKIYPYYVILPKDINDYTGKAIAMNLECHKITQETLAQELNLTQPRISQIIKDDIDMYDYKVQLRKIFKPYMIPN